jgi:hypothetical protein
LLFQVPEGVLGFGLSKVDPGSLSTQIRPCVTLHHLQGVHAVKVCVMYFEYQLSIFPYLLEMQVYEKYPMTSSGMEPAAFGW